MAVLISGHPAQKSNLMNCNPFPSLQSCTSSWKYLFYLVLWDLFIKFISVVGGIWRYAKRIVIIMLATGTQGLKMKNSGGIFKALPFWLEKSSLQ